MVPQGPAVSAAVPRPQDTATLSHRPSAGWSRSLPKPGQGWGAPALLLRHPWEHTRLEVGTLGPTILL